MPVGCCTFVNLSINRRALVRLTDVSSCLTNKNIELTMILTAVNCPVGETGAVKFHF